LLYGYGAYGISIDPAFSSDLLRLARRGLCTPLPHIRGGMDMGKPWHEDGACSKKKNTSLISSLRRTPDRASV